MTAPLLVDLSHTIEPDMPRFPSFAPPEIRPVWTHAQAGARGYRGTTCEVTEVRFVTSIGTYLDAPYHFDPGGDDISQIDLSHLVLPGCIVDLRSVAISGEPLSMAALDSLSAAGMAVLL